jgi:hypothetical protein
MMFDYLFHSEESSQIQPSLHSSVMFTQKFRNNLSELFIPSNWQVWVDQFPSSSSTTCRWVLFRTYVDSRIDDLSPAVILLLLWCSWGMRSKFFVKIAVLEIFSLHSMVRIRFDLSELVQKKELARKLLGFLTELPFTFSIDDIRLAFQFLSNEHKNDYANKRLGSVVDSISPFSALLNSNNLLQFLLQFFRSSSHAWNLVQHMNLYLQRVSIPVRYINSLSSITKEAMKSLDMKVVKADNATEVLATIFNLNQRSLDLCYSMPVTFHPEENASSATKDALRMNLLKIDVTFECHILFKSLDKVTYYGDFSLEFESLVNAKRDVDLWLAVAKKHILVWDFLDKKYKKNPEKSKRIREEFDNFPYDVIYKPLWFWLELMSSTPDREIYMIINSINQTVELIIYLRRVIIPYKLFYSLLGELRQNSLVAQRFNQFIWRENRPFFQELWYACQKQYTVLPVEISLAFGETEYYRDLWKNIYKSDNVAAMFVNVHCDESLNNNRQFLAFWLWYCIDSSSDAAVSSTVEAALHSTSVLLSVRTHLVKITSFGDLLVFLSSRVRAVRCDSLINENIARSLKYLLLKCLQEGSRVLETVLQSPAMWRCWKEMSDAGSAVAVERWEEIRLSEGSVFETTGTRRVSSMQLKRILWACFLTYPLNGKLAELVYQHAGHGFKLIISGISYSESYLLADFLLIFEKYDDIFKFCVFMEGLNFWDYLLTPAFQRTEESVVVSALCTNKRVWKLWGDKNRVDQTVWDGMFSFPQKPLLWDICSAGE